MLKHLFLILCLCQMAFAQKLSLDERRKQILSIVDEELSEVTRLARQQDFKSPDTLLRVSELNLEKARIWREVENERYLSIPPEKRRALNKKDYFKQSNQFFSTANDSAKVVVKRFPKYKLIGEVYYILAYNSKEIGDHDAAMKYFKLSSKTTPASSKVGHKSQLALADYYFNAQKFKKALPLYEASINKVDEKWWTKDAFNLAWCYYRTKNYGRAIDLMLEVHRKSSSDKYIDMRGQVERDIGVFYVDAGRVNDAVKFYEGLGLRYTEQFVKIANAIVTQGRFAQAESLLNQAAKNEKDPSLKIEILLAQLDLFEKYNKISSHLNVSQELVSLHKTQPLSETSFKKLTYHVNKKAAELQKATASNIYASVPKVKREKSEQAIAYFELAAILAPGQKAEKTFFQGETAYAGTQFAKAISLYVKAFDEAKVRNDKKIMNQSLEGMLAALAQPGLSKKYADKFYTPVYTRYLAFDSKSERAKSIYVKLFNTQFDGGDLPAAEATMADFAQKYPKDFKTQEGMLAKIMEHYRSKKDYSKVKAYVADINGGKYQVSKKYADALRSLMTKIQIEGVQTSLEKGQKGTALKGYHGIYNNPESTPKAKVNAAYNLSALYYEMGDATQSYNWGSIALKEMDAQDVGKLADSFLSISAGMFLRQQFSQSAELSYRLHAKLCKNDASNKAVSFKNAVFISLANGDLEKAMEIRNFGKGCMISDKIMTEVTLEVLKEVSKAKRWETYEALLGELESNAQNYPHLIRPYEDLRQEYLKLGDADNARKVDVKQSRFYSESKTKKLDVPVEALDLMADKLIVGVREKKQKIDQIRLSFPENDFNSAVKLKLKLLDQLAVTVNEIQKTGSGKGIVEAYKYVISAYEEFGDDLRGFTPPGKSPEYVASFQKAMSEVYQPILANARKQRQEIRKLIKDNKILTESNYAVLYSIPENFKRYVTVKESVLMDRGGRR